MKSTRTGEIIEMSIHHESLLALPDHSNETQAMVQARSVLAAFLLYLKANPLGSEIRDTSTLPSPKRIVIDAIRVLLAHEPRSEQQGQLQKVGLFLAQFQASDDLVDSKDASGDDALSEWIEKVSADDERWERVYVEQERLSELFGFAGRLGQRHVPAGSVATIYVADHQVRLHA